MGETGIRTEVGTGPGTESSLSTGPEMGSDPDTGDQDRYRDWEVSLTPEPEPEPEPEWYSTARHSPEFGALPNSCEQIIKIAYQVVEKTYFCAQIAVWCIVTGLIKE